MKKGRQGFTLIEILIVVAIIAILASVVLVGLGPTQQSGRDARRLSDVRQVQNALELYYNKCGFYPGTAACAVGSPGANWAALGTVIAGAGIGVSSLPADPSNNKTYYYAWPAGNASYILATILENSTNAVFNGYSAPVTAGYTWVPTAGAPASCSASSTFCITL